MKENRGTFIPMKVKISKKSLKSLKPTYKRLAIALVVAGDIEIEPDEVHEVWGR